MFPIKSEFFELIRKYRSIRKFRNYDLNNKGHYYSLAPFDYYSCIYIHIPKTAGTSISFSLFGNLAWGHHKIRDYEKIFTPRTMSHYLKFSFVRHPQTRLYSAFSFLKEGGATNKDSAWAQNNLERYHDFDSFVKLWVNEDTIFEYIHFVPQYQFLIDSEDKIKVDFIGKFEQLENDYKKISKRLNINTKLLRKNITKKAWKQEIVLSKKSEEIIRDVYRKDFEIFNYF